MEIIFFADDFELNYVSSGRDLLRKRGLTQESKKVVVFADPDYNRVSNVTSAAPARARTTGLDELLPPLPGTEREAVFLQQEAVRNGLAVQVYRGTEASKANLAKQDSPYILHLATHGLYLAPDQVPNLPAAGDAAGNNVAAVEPMTRSVLALAGAAVTLRDWKKGVPVPPENDGLLTAQQAADLNLDHTWLVVLSACDTGSGEAQAGEGVLGLRRGFAEAGAQNLLMTLWTADDAETASLMEAFYREALQSGSPAAALARVQAASLNDLRKRLGLSEAVRKAGPFILSY